MKQRFTLLLMSLLCIVAGVQAEAQLKVADVKVTVSGSSTVAITSSYIKPYSSSVNNGKAVVTYNQSSKTLTFYNVLIERTGKNNRAILNDGVDGLTIKFRGENKLKAEDASPVRLNGNTTITSEEVNGKVRTLISGGSQDAITVGKYDGKNKTLTINNANLYVEAKSSAFDSDGSPSLIIKNSTVVASNTYYKGGGDYDYYALRDYGSLTVENSNVTFQVDPQGSVVSNLASFTLGKGMQLSAWWSSSYPGSAYDIRFDKSLKNFYYGTSTTSKVVLSIHMEMGLAIDATNFPDANFRSYVKSFDKNSDGYFSQLELDAVQQIQVSNKGISSLVGVEHFGNLKLLQCNGNNLSQLDVSKLKYLNVLICDNNKLSSLNVTNNKELTGLTCGKNANLSSLNLQNNTELTTLTFNNTKISSINLSKNTKLNDISLYDCGITKSNWDSFVSTLPKVSSGYLRIASSETSSLLEISKKQVTAAKQKGWNVVATMAASGNTWINWEGMSEKAKLSFASKSITTTYGASMLPATPKLNNPQNVPVTYSSSNTSVATVNPSTGGITKVVGAGETTITAKFAGNSDYDAASAEYKLIVEKAKPQISFPRNFGQAEYGKATADVPTLSNPNKLTVTYSSSNTAVATVNSQSGAVTIKSAGEATITATFAGNANYQSGNAAYKLTVQKGKAPISFNQAAGEVSVGETGKYVAELINPQNVPVTYYSSNEAIATVDSKTGKTFGVSVGKATITAKFAGNANYEAGSVSYVLQVTKGVPYITAPTPITGLIANGNAQSLVIAGTTTGGEMQYSLDGKTFSKDIPTAKEAGKYTVYYKLVGGDNYYDVPGSSVEVTIAKASNTGLSFSSPTAEATYGQTYTTAPTLNNPNKLKVTYASSSPSVAKVDSQTGRVEIQSAGVTEITAKFVGDGTYDATTVTYTLTVNKAVPEVTAPHPMVGLTANGQELTLIGAGKTSAGEMQYSLDGTNYSTAIPTAKDAGSYTVYYKVVGNQNYEDVAPQTVSVSIAKASNTGLSFDKPTLEAKVGEAFTIPELSNPHGLEVSYSSSDPSVATVDDKTGAITIVGAGTAVITASFAGDATYESATASYTVTVTPAETTAIVITAKSYTREYGDANPVFEYEVSGGEINGEPEISCTANSFSDTGNYSITVSQGTVTNANVTFVPGQLTIEPATLKATVNSCERKEGEPNPEFTVTFTGWKMGESLNTVLYTVYYLICPADESSPAGEYPITISGLSVKNYMVVTEPGVLTVTSATAIDKVLATAGTFDVYTAGGQPVRMKATTLKGLAKGVYLVVANGQSRKVVVK